jgi:hypothetical protein
MKGYIYTMFRGADPGQGWRMTDPIFGKVPTLGACMPNIRRIVTAEDYLFVISGRVVGVHQYVDVVGGFQVAEKINALAAYQRFPQYRQQQLSDGSLSGNIIVQEDGSHSEVDYHSNFEKRVENYIIGKNSLAIETPEEIARARSETLDILSDIFQKPGQKIYDIIGRWRRLDEGQIGQLIEWIQDVKQNPSNAL